MSRKKRRLSKNLIHQEKEIVRLLLLYGNKMIDWDGIANTYIGPFMIAELSDVEFEQPDQDISWRFTGRR
jgi:DNA primase